MISCAVLPVARCCVISCAVLPVARCCAISYVVTLFKVTGYAVKPSRESRQKESGRSRLALAVDSASVLVVDSALVLSATCVDPCAILYGILNLPQRVRVRPDASHCARFIVPGCNEPSATEYPFTIT